MLNRPQRQVLAVPRKAGDDMMAGNGSAHHDKTQRFRDAALPHLDDLYTLARYLLHDAADADLDRRPPPRGCSFDHLVGQRQQLVRDFEAERLGGPEVYRQLEFRRLYHWQLAWRVPQAATQPPRRQGA
jgi:hypothetical protein